jgi:hypothetical protein
MSALNILGYTFLILSWLALIFASGRYAQHMRIAGMVLSAFALIIFIIGLTTT